MKQLASCTTGVSFIIKSQTWRAIIQVEKQPKYLGYFDTKEEACLAYDAAVDLYCPGRRKNFIEVPEAPPGARYLPATQGLFFLIDEEDYEEVSQYKWSVRAQRENGSPYIARSDRVGVPLHDFIMKDKLIDHIDGNTLDNRRSNLRKATNQQNSWNTSKTKLPCTSQYKGVCREKNSWNAHIVLNMRKTRLGCYQDEHQAAHAYNEASKLLHGEFGRLNTIPVPITEETLAKVHSRLKGMVNT